MEMINRNDIIASYINFDCEPNINNILQQYKDLIYLPVIHEKNGKMVFQSWDFNKMHLRKNPLFIKNIVYEPFGEFIKTEIPELIFVPAVAFDIKGNRVGYGAGYYDKTLESMENVIKIGVAFDFQVLDWEIEVESYDIGMDYILTEKRFIMIKKPNQILY